MGHAWFLQGDFNDLLTSFSTVWRYALPMRPFLMPSLLIICVMLSVAWSACAGEPTARHIPTFSECKKLASNKTDPQEKARITQMFKTNGMYCAMFSMPFQAQHVFNPGQTKKQLRIVMNSSNRYVVDGKTVLDAVLPDRASIPPAQMVMLAGQFISILGDLFSSDLNAETLQRMSKHVGTLTGVLGINARAALAQLDALRAQMRLGEDDVEPSFWLTKLAVIPMPPSAAVAAQNAQPHVGPAWMQKLMGAGQHLMGTFTGGGE